MPKNVNFDRKHERAFGLRVTSLDPKTGAVVSVQCRFCATFGRDEKEGLLRKANATVHYFTTPFRVDKFRSHHVGQHKTRWQEYEKLSDDGKSTYFDVAAKNTLEAHCGVVDSSLTFRIRRQIIDDVIGDLLFNDDDEEDTVARALTIFKPATDGGDDDDQYYVCKIKNHRMFDLTVRFLNCGASFRMTARLLQETKEHADLHYLAGAHDTYVATAARVVCAVDLQRLGDLLHKAWAFSLALDSGSHCGVSYLDFRARVAFQQHLFNFHLIAAPEFDRHTGENMFNLLQRLLDVICDDWKRRMIGVTTDGARDMTGLVRGVASRCQEVTLPGFIRVWGGAHQLDLVMQAIFKAFVAGVFLTTLTRLIGHLRRQRNLITAMRTQCPNFVDTRWLSMGKVLRWLIANRIRLMEHLLDKPAHAPDLQFWICVYALNEVCVEANIVCKKLQGKKLLVSQQTELLSQLGATYRRISNTKGPLNGHDMAELGPSVYKRNLFAVQIGDIRMCIDSLGSFVQEGMASLEPAEVDSITRAVGSMFLEVIPGVENIVAERNAASNADVSMPPVMPHELVKLTPLQFNAVLSHQRDRVAHSIEAADVERIEREFRDLKRTYHTERDTAAVIDGFDEDTSFEKGWATLSRRFPLLLKFVGGLATVFPGTATVESDFSHIRISKDEQRRRITDFSLEGCLHTTQYNDVLRAWDSNV